MKKLKSVSQSEAAAGRDARTIKTKALSRGKAGAVVTSERKTRVLVIHGPNLNLLGVREPEVYGAIRLAEIDHLLVLQGAQAGVEVLTFQSNHEGELVERVHTALSEEVAAIIINPAACTHTSVALRDALAGVAIPFVEVHLSNVYARESFRQHSYFSALALGVISGLGHEGYLLALDYVLRCVLHRVLCRSKAY